MAAVVRRTIKGRRYYYLEHTVRKGGRRSQRSLYLGKSMPKDIERIKRRFLFEVNKEEWFDDFAEIRRNYQDERRSMPKSAREKELREFSTRFTYNSQRIEGSTLTLRETAELIEHGVSPSGKPIEDATEARAHAELFEEVLRTRKDLSQELVEDWNWRLLKDTKPDVAGKIRRHGVRISGSRFVPPSPVELQPSLDDFFRWYDESKAKANPVELAGLVHLRFVTIHPFTDGNGRVSRLMMNFVLNRHGFPMLNIEYGRRASYYAALERSQLGENERPFITWFFRRYRREHANLLPDA
jgi:Fic family protein